MAEPAKKPALVAIKSDTLERQYVNTSFIGASSSEERMMCMSGERAYSAITRDGVLLNPAKVCMAWMEFSAEQELRDGPYGVSYAYEELASKKRIAGTKENGEALLSAVVKAIAENPEKGPKPFLSITLPNEETLSVGTGRAYDAGFSHGVKLLKDGAPLPKTGLEQKTRPELEEYVLACIKNNSLNFGSCAATGIEHAKRTVVPAVAKSVATRG